MQSGPAASLESARTFFSSPEIPIYFNAEQRLDGSANPSCLSSSFFGYQRLDFPPPSGLVRTALSVAEENIVVDKPGPRSPPLHRGGAGSYVCHQIA